MPDPSRQIATVTPAGERLEQLPEGVTFRDALTHIDDRGSVCEVFDPRWGWSEQELVFAYFFTIRPGMVKGWGMHLEHDDRYFILYGDLEVVMYDDRQSSPTRGLVSKVYLSEHHRRLMNIPPGIWHANRNVGQHDLTVINFPTRPYDHDQPDKYKLPLDTEQIPYSFGGGRAGLVSAGIALPCAADPRVSILIAAFGSDRFEHCLRSLADSLDDGASVEVIAVLNGAGPELRAVASAAAGLRVIDPPVNLGFPAGCNVARAAARGEYLVVVQDDGIITPGWLEALVHTADAHPEAGLVGGVSLWPGGERIIQAGQVVFSDGSVRPVAAEQPPAVLDRRAPYAVDTLSSHGMLVRASTWDGVGGLEEDYFPLYMVDLTLSRQVWALGEAVLCAPSARTEHARNSSTKPRFRSFVFHRHYDMWRARWTRQIADHEPLGEYEDVSIERALGRAEALWRRARPAPAPLMRPAPPYDPDGDEQQRLRAGIRFAGLALDVRERYCESLEADLERLEQELARTRVHAASIDTVRQERELANAAEVAYLRARARTLAGIEAGRWWRLRARLLPLLRLASWARRAQVRHRRSR